MCPLFFCLRCTFEEFFPRQWQLFFVFASTVPSYVLYRVIAYMNENHPRLWLTKYLARLPSVVGVFSEINLAMFYFWGSYYQFIKRLFGFRNVSLISYPKDACVYNSLGHYHPPES